MSTLPPRPALTPLLYALFRVADRLGAPLSAARRGGEQVDPRPELRGQAYDVAHSARCWAARRRELRRGALSQVAADLLLRPVDPDVDPASAVAAELPGGWMPGHRVHVFRSNSEDFARRLELVSQARRSVWCAFWCIKGDDSGRRFLEAVRARTREGVRVGVVLDANVATRLAWIEPRYPEFLAALRAAGAELHLVVPPSPSQNTHRKIFAVDGRYAIVGGRNIGDHYALDNAEGFLDTDVELEGPAAAAVQALILQLAGVRGPVAPAEPAFGDARVALVDQPAALHPVEDRVVRCLVQAVRHARRRIDLAFAYVILLPALRRAILDAHQRGVAVRVLTNSATSVDYPYWAGAAYGSLDALVRAGVPVYRMRSRCLHSKCCVVDGELSTVGSHNLWTLSTLHDAETNLFIASPSVGADLTRLIDERLAEAVRVEPSNWSVPADRGTRVANHLVWACEGGGKG